MTDLYAITWPDLRYYNIGDNRQQKIKAASILLKMFGDDVRFVDEDEFCELQERFNCKEEWFFSVFEGIEYTNDFKYDLITWEELWGLVGK